MQGHSHASSGDQGWGTNVTSGQLKGSPGAWKTKAISLWNPCGELHLFWNHTCLFCRCDQKNIWSALQEILEPWRPGELSPAPAAASNNTPHKSKLYHLTVCSFPTANSAIISASFPVPQLVSGVGGLGGRSSRYGVGMTGKWQGKSSSSKIVRGPLAKWAWAHESDRHGFKPHLQLPIAVLPRVSYSTSLWRNFSTC